MGGNSTSANIGLQEPFLNLFLHCLYLVTSISLRISRCVKYWEFCINVGLFSIGAQSEYSWRKMLSGVAAFLIGLIFLVVGIFIHLRAWKGNKQENHPPALGLPTPPCPPV
jgi:hypothetical protein